MRIVAAVVVALLAPSAFAGGGYVSDGKPMRKPAPPDASDDIVKAFVAGIVADKKGDLSKAAHQYDDANRKTPSANAYYNHADVMRRMEQIEAAIKSYQKYLELAPSATDRKDVLAIIESLQKSDFIGVIDGDDADALVFLDGKLLGPSPQVVRPPEGMHAAARVSPAGFRHRTFDAKPGKTEHMVMSDHDRSTKPQGNIVVSTSGNFGSQGSWYVGKVMFEFPGRFALEPGHYDTWPFDDKSGKRMCNSMVFDVPKLAANELFFVWVDTPKKNKDDYRCSPITVKTQKVAFPAGGGS